jgi:hypothetical protein
MDSTAVSTNYGQMISDLTTNYQQAMDYQKQLSNLTTKFEADQSALTMQNSIAKGLSSLVTNLSRNITG